MKVQKDTNDERRKALFLLCDRFLKRMNLFTKNPLATGKMIKKFQDMLNTSQNEEAALKILDSYLKTPKNDLRTF